MEADNPGKKTIESHQFKHRTNGDNCSDSVSDGIRLILCYALSVRDKSEYLSQWIVVSGATARICNSEELFHNLKCLKQQQEVTLGDGRPLKVTGKGNVTIKLRLPNGKHTQCKLHNVLLVPEMAYNLLSVNKALEARKTLEFCTKHCYIKDINKKIQCTCHTELKR